MYVYIANTRYQVHKHTYLDLAHLGGHARHIVPPLSPSQPAIAEAKISRGKARSRSFLLSLLFVTFFFSFVFSLQVMRREDKAIAAVVAAPEPSAIQQQHHKTASSKCGMFACVCVSVACSRHRRCLLYTSPSPRD